MMPRHVGLLVVLFFGVAGSGCATVVHGTTQAVPVTTDPPGASVIVDGGEETYTTPVTLELERKHDHLLTITMPGYQNEAIEVNRKLSGALAGNILAGGLVGWGVDAVSGAQFKLQPKTVVVTLTPVGEAGDSEPALSGALAPQDRLLELERLRREGAVTGDEYEARRSAILEELGHAPS